MLDDNFLFESDAPLRWLRSDNGAMQDGWYSPIPIGSITLSGLAVAPGLGQVVLTWATAGLQAFAAKTEIWASQTNNVATAAFFGEVNPSVVTFTRIVSPQSGAYYYWIRSRDVLGGFSAWQPGATNGVQGQSNNIPGLTGQNFALINGTITSSIAASAVTFAIKTVAGADPSPADPVIITFRNNSTGVYVDVPITGPISMTVSSGSTLGATNGTPFRVWLCALSILGGIALAVGIRTSVTQVFPLNEDTLMSSTAEGGAGGADTLGTMYSTAIQVSKQFRILGYMDWTSGLAAAGTWNVNADDRILSGSGTKKPGELVQSISNRSAAKQTGATSVTSVSGVPTSAEGDQYFSTQITPTSAINYLQHDIQINGALDQTTVPSFRVAAMLFQSTSANAIACNMGAALYDLASVGSPVTIPITTRAQALSTGTLTFTVRAGPVQSGGTVNFGLNCEYTATLQQLFGGTLFSGHQIQEFMA